MCVLYSVVLRHASQHLSSFTPPSHSVYLSSSSHPPVLSATCRLWSASSLVLCLTWSRAPLYVQQCLHHPSTSTGTSMGRHGHGHDEHEHVNMKSRRIHSRIHPSSASYCRWIRAPSMSSSGAWAFVRCLFSEATHRLVFLICP